MTYDIVVVIWKDPIVYFNNKGVFENSDPPISPSPPL